MRWPNSTHSFRQRIASLIRICTQSRRPMHPVSNWRLTTKTNISWSYNLTQMNKFIWNENQYWVGWKCFGMFEAIPKFPSWNWQSLRRFWYMSKELTWNLQYSVHNCIWNISISVLLKTFYFKINLQFIYLILVFFSLLSVHKFSTSSKFATLNNDICYLNKYN